MKALMSIAFVSIAGLAFADEPPTDRVGVVNIEEAIADHPPLSQKLAHLRLSVEKSEAIFLKRSAEMSRLEDELRNERSDDARKAKQAQLGQLKSQFKEEVSAERKKMLALESRAYAESYDRIQDVAVTIAERDNLAVVVFVPKSLKSGKVQQDLSRPKQITEMPSVAYVGKDPKLNITAEVRKMLASDPVDEARKVNLDDHAQKVTDLITAGVPEAEVAHRFGTTLDDLGRWLKKNKNN